MILIRQHLLPKFFEPSDLRELDAAEYEEFEGVPHEHHALVQIQLTFRLIYLSVLIMFRSTIPRGGCHHLLI